MRGRSKTLMSWSLVVFYLSCMLHSLQQGDQIFLSHWNAAVRITSLSKLIRKINSFRDFLVEILPKYRGRDARIELLWCMFRLAMLPDNCSIFANIDLNAVTCLISTTNSRLYCDALWDKLYAIYASFMMPRFNRARALELESLSSGKERHYRICIENTVIITNYAAQIIENILYNVGKL